MCSKAIHFHAIVFTLHVAIQTNANKSVVAMNCTINKRTYLCNNFLKADL